jgi:hypothetical protein
MQGASSPGVNVNAKPFTPTTAQGARTRSPVVDAVLTQSARLSERVAEAGDLSGLAPDVRMSFMRQAQIESIYGLGDFDSDYEPAEPAIKAIFTMVGEPAAQFRLPLLASIAAVESKYMEWYKHWREFQYSNSVTFEDIFVGGRAASGIVRDSNAPTQQFFAWISTEYIKELKAAAWALGQLVATDEDLNERPFCIRVPQKIGRSFVPAAHVIRNLVEQSGKSFFLDFNKKDYPGEMLLVGDIDEDEAEAISRQGGFQLFGDKRFGISPYERRQSRSKFFLASDRVDSVSAAVRVVAPQIAGFLRLQVSDLRFSSVPQSLIYGQWTIIQVEYADSPFVYDQVFELKARRVLRLVHPEKLHLGSFAVKVAGQLDEMQRLLGGRLLKPPEESATEEEEDSEPLVIDATAPVRLLGAEESSSEA